MRTIALIAATLAAPLHAAEADPALPDPTIVVTANRTPTPLARVGQSISIIDLPELERRQSQTVADVLRTIPGVTIARNGGLGGVASVFIRGADSEQTVALIDGVKLNDPSTPGGGFNFGNLMIGNIERIEVLRGSQSVLWGSQAIAGVVNMITRRPTERLAVNARGEVGYRGTANLVANVSGQAGPLSASVGGGWLRSDGISAFAESRGGREPDGYENWGANANLTLALGDDVSVDARGWLSRGRVNQDGFPPPSFAFADVNETAVTREIVGYTGINAALFGGRLRNRLGLAITDTDRRNSVPTSSVPSFAGEGRNERIEYQGIAALADGWEATFGAEQEISRFATSSNGGAVTSGRARLYSLYANLVASPAAGLTLTGGVRRDDHDRFGDATSLAASGVYTLGASGTTLRASYAEGFKAPSLFQLLSNFGNSLLRPERARGWDAGVTQALAGGRLQLAATWFQRDSRDLIIFISCPQPLAGICTGRPFGTYDNIARARAEGLEAALTLKPVDGLTLQASHTYVDSRNRTPGNANLNRRLPRRPEHSSSLAVDYRWGFGLETGVSLLNVGPSFENASNATRLPGYTLVDVRAALPVGKRLELTARIENLFNAAYETALRFGQPGRAGYIGARVRI